MEISRRLGPGDWIEGALGMLAESGIDAVRIEPLAAKLKVTRGSFYWHFRDRDALLAALVDEWETRETGGVIARIEKGGGNAKERLARLVDYCVSDDGRLETELRVWGLRDAAVARRIQAADMQRIGYLAALFREAGARPDEAALRARHLYNWWQGQFLFKAGESYATRRNAARHLLDCLLARPQ